MDSVLGLEEGGSHALGQDPNVPPLFTIHTVRIIMDIREIPFSALGTRGKLTKPTIDSLIMTVDRIATDGTIHF